MDASRTHPSRVGSVVELARELTLARDRAGLTVRQVEKLTGIINSTLGGYFSGRHRPSLENLVKVLAACGISDPEETAAWRDALLRVRRAPRRKRPTAPPYRGLESFQPDDAAWFFGRSRLTQVVLARLAERAGAGRPLVLVGPSGSGKSSLLRAGVVAALRACERTCVTVFTPGREPVAELGRRIADVDPAKRTVLVVDQLEEVFAPEVPEDERAGFVAALATTSADVVIGLRADFYAQALRYPQLAAALQDDQVIIDPMDADELREVICAPATMAGVEVDDGLVELLLHEVYAPSPAGTLPLLSHALLATWQRSGGIRMTVADYRATGGLGSAVARSAEEVVAALGPDHDDAVRGLFLRLVHVAPEVPDTRRRVHRSELPEGTGDVLDQFVARRLVVVDADSVEIAHEALLVAWPRLKDWIDGDRAGIVDRSRLAEGARDWRESGADPDTLLRGARLVTASDRFGQPRGAELNDLERGFLRASEEQECLRLATRLRQTRRLHRLVAALSVLLVVAAGLGVVSVAEAVTMGHDRDLAVSRQVAVRADALRAKDPALAAQLAVAAYRIAATPEALSSLLNATAVAVPARLPGPAAVTESVAVNHDRGLLVSASGSAATVQVWSLEHPGHPVLVADTPPAAAPLQAVALSPDGRTLAAGGAGGVVTTYDVADLRRPGAPVPLAGRGGAVFGLAFTLDGRSLLAATADGVRRWRLGARSDPEVLPGSTGTLQSVAVSPDGLLVAAGSTDGSTFLWTIGGPTPVTLPPLTGPTGKVYAVAFSPDGHTLAAGSGDRSVYRWDIREPGRPVPAAPLTGPTNWVNAVAFSPDGATLAAGSSDGNARLWDVGTGRLTATLPHPGPVTTTAFLDDATLATGEADGVAHLWPVHGPVLTGFDDAVFALDFDSAGGVLAIGPGAKDDTARLWTTRGAPRPLGRPVRNPLAEPKVSGSAAVTPDGRTLAVGRVDGSVVLWDVGDPDRPVPLGAPLTGSTALVEQLVISPDGRQLTASGDDNTVRRWDITVPAAPRPLATLTGPTSYAFASAFSLDGRLLATASADTFTYLWDIGAPDRPRLVATLRGPSSYAYSPAFSPDGRVLAVGSADKTVRLWDISVPDRPEPLGDPLTGPANYVYSVAFSPDGATLAGASTDGTVWLWDVHDPRDAHPSAVLTGPTDAVFSVAWSPDGRQVAAGSADHTVRLWSTDPQDAAGMLCAMTGAGITADEWARLVPDLPYDPTCGS